MSTLDPELMNSEQERRRREESDRQSRKLGEKLLQGWCMLEETCPVGCLVPLMRSRQGRDYCVSCELFTDEIEEKQKAQEAQAKTKSAPSGDMEDACEPRCQIEQTLASAPETVTAPQPSTGTAGSSPATTSATPSASLSSFPPPVHFPTPSGQHDGSAVYPITGLAPPQHPSAALHQHTHHHHQPHFDQHHYSGYVNAAVATLYQKMEEARQRLAVTHVSQCAHLVGIITECARAIDSLHSLSTKF